MLRPGASEADTLAWGRAWIAAHPGDGSCDPDHTEDDETSQADREYKAMKARDAIERSVPITPDTTSHSYLQSRGIAAGDPDRFRHLPQARTGDDAFLVKFGDPVAPVAVQLTYLDAHGRKSTVLPNRRSYRLRWDQPRLLTFPGNPGERNETVICEGVENALSINANDPRPVIGLPGIGVLQHVPVKGRGRRFIILRDGDAPGSEADKALWKGIDALLLQGAESVRVTETPLKADANSILVEHGPDAMAALLADAVEHDLTDEGEVERIHRITNPYERERAILEAKKARKLSKGFVRDRLADLERLDKVRATADDAVTSSPIPSEPEPWTEPVNLGDLLDEIEALIAKFIATDEPEIVIVVTSLWAVHAHLMHHPQVHLGASPRLYVAGNKHNTGKSTLADSVGLLMPRTMIGSDLTGPALFRSIEEGRHSLVIHQANTLFRRDGSAKSDGLASVLNSGHRRREAVIRRVVPMADGSQKPQAFSSWAPMVIDGIRFLPSEEMRSRCIELWMHPATEQEALGLLDLDLHEGLFIDLKRKLMRWADDLAELDLQPALPQRIYSRNALNWRILFAIAHTAGERWVAKVEHAAITILDRDSDDRDTIGERLLRSIHSAFEKQREIDRQPGHVTGTDSYGFLSTQTLIAYLLTDPREQWARANKGHPIDDYYLRDHLKMLVTRDATRIDAGRDASGKRQRLSGYFRHQFYRPWFRYLNLIEQPISARIPVLLPFTCRPAVQGPVQSTHPANGNGAAHPAKPRKTRTRKVKQPPPAEQSQVTPKDATP